MKIKIEIDYDIKRLVDIDYDIFGDDILESSIEDIRGSLGCDSAYYGTVLEHLSEETLQEIREEYLKLAQVKAGIVQLSLFDAETR